MTVQNMASSNRNSIPNQFIIKDGNKEVFQSYDSVIAIIENGQIYLDEYYWNYSNTTSKYRNLFLGLTTPETKKKIENKEIILKNLN